MQIDTLIWLCYNIRVSIEFWKVMIVLNYHDHETIGEIDTIFKLSKKLNKVCAKIERLSHKNNGPVIVNFDTTVSKRWTSALSKYSSDEINEAVKKIIASKGLQWSKLSVSRPSNILYGGIEASLHR